MGAIVLDASKVNSYVLPSLNKSKNTMQEAYSTGQSLRNSLPSSFSYRSTVNEIVSQIYNIQKEIGDIDTIISKKVEKAKTIENKASSKASGIASAIGSVVGGIAGAVVGTTVGAVGGAVVGGVAAGVVGSAGGAAVAGATGAVVGATIGSSIGKAIVNTGAKIVDGATKVAKGICDGIKGLGTAIWNGCKKVAKTVTSFIKEKVIPVIKNIANAIWDALKWVGKQIVKTVATIVNVAVSLLEGFVSFIEAIGDVVLLAVGVVCTVFTFLSDLIQGIATGEWEWKATGAVWKKWIMPWVGYDWTSKAFSWQGKWIINDWAYKPFKRGETGAKIVKGVGYVVGIVIASIFTAGGAAAASGAASAAGAGASTAATAFIQGGTTALLTNASATMATNAAVYTSTALAGVAKIGQSAQSGYNSLSDEEKQSGASITKVIGASAIKGVVEAATWYVTYGNGSKILASSNNKVLTKTGLTKLGNLLSSDASKRSITASTKYLNKILPSVSKATFTKAGIQAGKEYINAVADAIVTGEYDIGVVTQKAFVSASTSIIYDNTFSSWLKNGEKATSKALEKMKANQVADVADDVTPIPVSNEAKQTSLKQFALERFNEFLKFSQTDGGKKIVGTGIKNVIKEGENAIINDMIA